MIKMISFYFTLCYDISMIKIKFHFAAVSLEGVIGEWEFVVPNAEENVHLFFRSWNEIYKANGVEKDKKVVFFFYSPSKLFFNIMIFLTHWIIISSPKF